MEEVEDVIAALQQLVAMHPGSRVLVGGERIDRIVFCESIQGEVEYINIQLE